MYVSLRILTRNSNNSSFIQQFLFNAASPFRYRARCIRLRRLGNDNNNDNNIYYIDRKYYRKDKKAKYFKRKKK